MGSCPQCGFPISEDNRKILLDNANIEENAPDVEVVQKSQSVPSVILCVNCGFTMSPSEVQSGMKCPSCGCDPIKKSGPPDTSPSAQSVHPSIDQEQSPKNDTPPPRAQSCKSSETVRLEFVIGKCIGNTIELNQGEPIGRDNFINDPNCSDEAQYISSKHFKFEFQLEKLYIRDLGSTNGTSVNDTEMEEDEPYLIFVGDRIIIGDGIMVFRLISYSQDQNPILPTYQLREINTNVVYPLNVLRNPSEIFGRQPYEGGSAHPFLVDVHWHRMTMGEDSDVVNTEYSYISRKHFELSFNHTSEGAKFTITNFSSNGTKVNDVILDNSGDSMDIELGGKIKIAENFECVLEKI